MEQSTLIRYATSAGAKNVGLSFHSLAPRLPKRSEWLIAERLDPDSQAVYLASGGHSVAKKLNQDGIRNYVQKYEDFVENNASYISLCSEFDGPLSPAERAVHRTRMQAMLGSAFAPVWDPSTGAAGLEGLAGAFQTVAVTGADARENRVLSSKMVPLTNRLGTRWHALDGARPDDLFTGRFASAATTAWLSPMKYGETLVWDGNKMVRYQKKMKDQARRRHRSTFRQAGFDAEAILNDNNEEIARFTVWSFMRLEEAVSKRKPGVEMPFSATPEAPSTDLSTSVGWNETGNTAETPPSDVDSSALVVRNSAQLPAKREERQILPVFGFEAKESTEYDNDGKQITVSRNLLRKSNVPLRQCDTCLVPETPVLLSTFESRPIGDLEVGDVLLGFTESGRRQYEESKVEAIRRSLAPVFDITTESGRVVTATSDHRWLVKADSTWVRTSRLTALSRLRRLDVQHFDTTDDFRRGYIAGITLGDGTLRTTPASEKNRQIWWRVAMADTEPLNRLCDYLGYFGFPVAVRPFNGGGGSAIVGEPNRGFRDMWRVEFRATLPIACVAACAIDSGAEDYAAGYLSGFFDAEGSFDGHTVRVSQRDVSVLEYIAVLGERLGLKWLVETYENDHCPGARLLGGHKEVVKFFTRCFPAITRKTGALLGKSFLTHDDRVVSVTSAGVREVVDIQTSTGTFIANGLATHNCHIAATCPGFQPGTECVYSLPVEIKTKDQILAANLALLEMQMERVAFMRLAEEQSGGYADPNLSLEIDRMLRMQEQIKKIEDNAEYIKVNVEARGGMGVLSRLLGETASKAKEIAPAIEPHYLEAEIVDGRVEVVN